MTRAAFLTACALALLACSSDPQVSAKNASTEEVAQKLEATGAGESFVNPGKWQSRVTVEELNMPGMPAAMVEQMKAARGQPQVHEQCLSEQDARRPKEGFFGGRENCRYERFTMGGGKIDAVMNCSDSGGTQKMTMAGTYSGNSYDMRMTMGLAGGSGEAGMSMKMRVQAQRIGECTGKEPA